MRASEKVPWQIVSFKSPRASHYEWHRSLRESTDHYERIDVLSVIPLRPEAGFAPSLGGEGWDRGEVREEESNGISLAEGVHTYNVIAQANGKTHQQKVQVNQQRQAQLQFSW
jgi:hypothetical protein